MIRNYLKVAWRNLWKNKVFSGINIIGLAIGMAACILIMLFVFYERSFDRFHSKNIYRLNEVQKFEGMVAPQKVALTMFPMAPTLKNDFPEIKDFTRLRWTQKMQITYGEKRLYLPQVFIVDSTFLQIFDFELISGNRATALEKPNNIVLTEKTVHKLFGNENPIGKTITHYGEDTASFVVTGVLKDIPDNSQLQFDALFAFNTHNNADWMNNWGGNWLNTYLVLTPGTDVAALEKKFPAYLKKYMTNGDGWKNYELFLLPLKDVHAGATDIGLDYVNFQKFDKTYVNLFSVIALIVLLIACINFMNLSTARSAERAREVGVRKSIGAHRFQLALQFLSETVLLSLIALVLAVTLVKLCIPYVNELSQRQLSLPIFTDIRLWFYLIGATIILGIISGLYPAAYLSSFQPVKVLKGTLESGSNKGRLRNILVVTQFASAIFLMIATVFAVRQLNYMQDRDPGFQRDQIVTIPLDGNAREKYEVLKQELSNGALVNGVTAAQDVLGSHLDQSGIEFKGNGPLRQLTSTRLIVDPDYVDLFHLSLLYGKNFSKDGSGNGKEYIINESLAKELLKDNPKEPLSSLIGKRFGFDSLGTITGIARDFNFNSMHNKIETMFLFNNKDWSYSQMSVKINGKKAKEALAFIGSVWKKNFPDRPLEYQFLDEHFEELYKADMQVSRIVGILAFLAIIISCLGLFGLASYSAERRVKEVGIRKVMGASIQNIILLLSKNFIKLVFIANIIAWPLAWYALNKWLEDYAYRVNISWWVFLLSGLGAMLIAVVTISFQAIRAAVANPMKSLRNE
ncbi:MAG: ABC transporter permease [Flavisolibacter sp.]